MADGLVDYAQFFFNPIVTLCFQTLRKLRSAGFHDAPLHHNVYEIGRNIVQQALIVSNDQETAIFLR